MYRGYRRRNRHSCHHGHDSGEGAIGCAIILVLAVICMPIAGLIMMGSEDEGTKALGGVLLFVGAIIWLFALLGA